MGFRAKQILGLTLVAASVALATSVVNLAALVRLSVAETESRATFLAETLYHQASNVIRREGRGATGAALASDEALRSYAEGIVGYSATTMYVAVTDKDGFALVHSNPLEVGDLLTSAPELSELTSGDPFSQLWALYRGHSVLEVAMPFDVDGERFGAVHVAISTLFLQQEIAGALTRNVVLATAVVLGAFALSLVFANWLLAPIEMLRRELARIRTAEGEPPLDLKSEADVSRLAEFFGAMSQQLADGRSGKDTASSLSAMLEGLADAVLVVSGDGQVMSMNGAAERVLGRARRDLDGAKLADSLPEDHPVALVVAEALERQEAVGPREIETGDDAGSTTYSVTAQILRDESGISGVMVSARDVEKLSRLGSQLSYSQKLAALGKLTSGVAHEIKNPLNAMVIHVALLRERLARASPQTQASLDTLEREIRRLDQVIQGFLRFTRPEDLRLVAVPLGELFDEVERLVAAETEAAGIEVRVEVPEGLPPVYGDRELLQQVFLNLVQNAEDAMPEGGTIDIVASSGEDGVRVVVSDTGSGIDPELLERIFDLYVTTKAQGSGIGLSMVYRIVQLHGGEIKVESSEGRGARFTVGLPEVPR